MVEARDIIARVIYELSGDGQTLTYANRILAALTAAGWTLAPPGSRVVPEGGVDAETVEHIAKLFDKRAEITKARYGPHHSAIAIALADAAALRALAEAKP